MMLSHLVFPSKQSGRQRKLRPDYAQAAFHNQQFVAQNKNIIIQRRNNFFVVEETGMRLP